MLRGLGSTVISDLSHFTIKLYAVLSRIDPADPQAVTALEPGLRAVLSIFIGCKTKVIINTFCGQHLQAIKAKVFMGLRYVVLSSFKRY